MTGANQRHPEPETLSAFADGRLGGSARAAVVEHLDVCHDCMSEVALALRVEHRADSQDGGHERGAAQRTLEWRRWYPAAAGIALVVLGIAAFRDVLPFARSPIRRLVELAPKTERTVEPRLTGGFAWAEYAGAARTNAESANTDRMKLVGAAGEIVARAGRDGDADAQHAAGVAMVLVQNAVEGIPRLEAAVRTSDDARVWSDLAAARYAAASQLGRASLYPLALAAADHALRIDPELAEALFNRALILERLGLTGEARRAWERYLEVDAASPWAAEARAHLADLPAASRSSQFERDRPLLESAADRGDAAAVRRYSDAHRDRVRGWAEAEYLGRWGQAIQRKDEKEAARWLTTARAIGAALAELSGESLPRDAVQAIDRSSSRDAIAAAHVLYRDARIAYSRNEREAAERDLLRAAKAFETLGSPMALAARYYAASARLARNDTSGARTDLDRVRLQVDAHSGYMSLGAHVRWELGRAYMLDYDWAGAVPVLTKGAAMFRRCGERSSEAFVETMLARALSALGRDDDAWVARMRAFAALSAEGASDLLATSIAAAMQTELLAGHDDAALALSALELSVAREATRPQMLFEAQVNRSRIESATGHVAAAVQSARQAESLAKAATDATLRAQNLGDAAAALGAALAENDPRAAAASLTRAIDFYAAHELQSALPELLLLRARTSLRAGDAVAAMRDLEQGMAVVERHGAREAGLLDAEHALFGDAIRISLDRGRTEAAFALAERSRGAVLTTAELQRRLAGSGTAVVELVALPEELIAFAVNAKDVFVARSPRARETLAALSAESLSESGTTAVATLYDEVIRPVEAVIAQASEVVFVPDARLEGVPFAALYDRTRQRYLIERLAVSIASSAASLQPEPVRMPVRTGSRTLTVIALPSGGAESAALPEAEREVRDVAALYARTESIPAGGATFAAIRGAAADVVHIAGHTERQPGGGEQALLLAGERVTWRTIVGAPFAEPRLMVLAACETLRPPASAATRALSLGGAFVAAGAGGVVGTLAPIGDRDARLLFRALHRQLAAGARPAEALRAAQQEAIEREGGGRRAWRFVALLTRHIAAAPR